MSKNFPPSVRYMHFWYSTSKPPSHHRTIAPSPAATCSSLPVESPLAPKRRLPTPQSHHMLLLFLPSTIQASSLHGFNAPTLTKSPLTVPDPQLPESQTRKFATRNSQLPSLPGRRIDQANSKSSSTWPTGRCDDISRVRESVGTGTGV